MIQSTDESSLYPFEFRGSSREYFGIWIVNLLLTIITLGIYSAWAKVRTKRYFYGNTLVDGSAFDYTAKPIKILAGRLIAVVMFVAYQNCLRFFPAMAPFVLAVFLLVLPVIYMASLAFNMRYSVWRGISFKLHKNTPAAYLIFSPLILYMVIAVFAPLLYGLSPEDLTVSGG